MKLTRRSFATSASLAAAGSLLGLRPFGALNALAQPPSSYKALVCVFLYGGNDANNTLIPYDSNYATYASLRGGLALPHNAILPLNASFALHPSMPEVQSLFTSSKAAIVSNVGTLVEPLTQAQFQYGSTPPTNLFSHIDQQLEWQNADVSSSTPTGWAGRAADLLTPSFAASTIPMIVSVNGDTLFGNGASTSPVAVSPGNAGQLDCTEGSACNQRQLAAQALLTLNTGVSLVQADNNITSNAYKYSAVLADALASLPTLQTHFPANNYLAYQLLQIAQIIQARSALNAQRQIFFCGIGGFDTHSNQLPQQAALLQQLSQALNAFYSATVELGLADSITTFTMSDFSRTFQPNSNSGSDHAWGSHHVVLGAAVNGGQLYGSYPTLAFGGPNDADIYGRWIPTTSNSQYAATLAQWFGVPSGSLSTVFPLLPNFSSPTLAFL